MKRLATLVFIISFVVAQTVHAETTVSSGGSARPTGGSMNVNDTAKKSGSSAGKAQMMNVAMAGAMVAASKGCTITMLCVMAAATVAQSMLMGGGKKNAGSIAKATDGGAGFGGNYSSPTISDGGSSEGSGYDSGSGGDFSPELLAIEKQLQDAGFAMSADGSSMSLPNGQTASMKDLAGGNVPGFELTDDVKAQANQIAEEVMKKSGAKVVAVGLEEGGGGGGSGNAMAAEEASSKFDMSAYLKGLNKRDPSSVSGLSKKLGEDNIGIKSDNIFEMVSRQYKRKQTQRAFMN